MARGKRAEKEYAKLYKNVSLPTEEEDCNEHWDLKINEMNEKYTQYI